MWTPKDFSLGKKKKNSLEYFAEFEVKTKKKDVQFGKLQIFADLVSQKFQNSKTVSLIWTPGHTG